MNNDLDILIAWANINSHSENREGLAAMRELLREAFHVLGGREELLGQALRIRKREDAPIQILLGGHMDTVFPVTSAFQRAERMGDRLKGPGVADMKGGLLVMLRALQAFEKNAPANVGWEVLITADEEIGSTTSYPLWKEAGSYVQAAFLFEPSFSDGALVSSRKGSMNVTITAEGKAAHAGRNLADGKNAIMALAKVIAPLEGINIGFIEGGGPVNIVPAFARCRLNARADSIEMLRSVEKKISNLVEEVSKETGVRLTMQKDSYRPPKPFDAKTEALFNLAKTVDPTLTWRPTGGVCDGNFLAEAGVPTIDTLGVIGDNLHREDEYMLVTSLESRIQLTTSLLRSYATR